MVYVMINCCFCLSFTKRLEMIKRRFYRLEHGDNDNASDSSVSSSDSEPDAYVEESQDDVEVQEDDDESCSTSSGFTSLYHNFSWNANKLNFTY